MRTWLSAVIRTCSSTDASATSGSSMQAASACRTSRSRVLTGPCSGPRLISAAPSTSRRTLRRVPSPTSGRRPAPRRRPISSSASPVSAPELVVVGRVGKSHGLDGSFVVEEASETRELFAVGAKLVVEGADATVVGSKQARGRPVIRLDRRVARGTPLQVRREALGPTAENEYYVFQLIGLRVEEEGGRELGRVADVSPGIANDVLELDSGLTLPLVEDCVLAVDVKGGRIVIAPGFSAPG